MLRIQPHLRVNQGLATGGGGQPLAGTRTGGSGVGGNRDANRSCGAGQARSPELFRGSWSSWRRRKVSGALRGPPQNRFNDLAGRVSKRNLLNPFCGSYCEDSLQAKNVFYHSRTRRCSRPLLKNCIPKIKKSV